MQNNTPEIILVSESTFKSNPSAEFLSKDKSFVIPDSSVVTVIGDKMEFSNIPKANFVPTLCDLDALRTQITSRPLVLFVTCGKHVPQGQKLNKYGDYLSMRDPEWWLMSNTPWTHPYTHPSDTSVRSRYAERYIVPRFVVSVDTAHPNIRRQLNDGFDKAERFLRDGTAFAIEFNFNPMILHWWKQQGARRYDSVECLEMTVTTGASFVITNHGPLNHCFDCQFIWCACLPCYCLSAVPYKIWRNLVQMVRDVDFKMEGSVTTAYPSSPGYKLSELHHCPVLLEGMVPSDPPMPHGIFDQPFMQPIPNVLARIN